MSSLSKELILLILQFLDEEGMKETLHKLEQESGAFFNMKFFEEKVLAGDWDEVEKYLFGFSKIDDNRYSMKIFFEIRKQKYLEALDKKDTTEAVEVLVKQLKFFQTFNDDLYKEITQLLTLENFRENEQLSKYGDTRTARSMMLMELKKLIEANPLFRDKLAFPTLKQSRLRTLINQSLNWQHQLCKNPRPNPDVKTLFMDHACAPTNGARPVTPLAVPVARPSTYVPLVPHGPFQPTATVANANANGMAGWMANAIASSSGQSAVTTNSAVPLPPNQGVSILKRPRTPPNTMGMVDYHDQEQLLKRMRSGAQALADECRQLPAMDDLPRTVVCTLHQGSDVTSIDFHPSYQTLVLVGLANGDLALWEIGTQKKLLSKPFYVWDMSALSSKFQATFPNGSAISVSHVAWSPDGEFMGVAYTKHLIHLYSCQGPTDLRQLLEIEAHAGGVNDLAFCLPNKQLCVVTCGDDKQMKVWDLSGRNIYNFEGHAAPVYSVCPHHKESIQFIFSTSTDGKIKAWLYDSGGSRVDYDAPGNGCTKLLYSADGTRLFSCGTSVEGATFLVEWNESEGSQKRTYLGLRTKSNGIVQFDTTQNRYLAAGEDHQIKFWNMDNINMLTSTDADGGLPSRPRLKFNKQGNLLLVSTEDNGFKILANAEGLRTLKALEGRSSEMVRTHNEPSGVTAPGPSAIVNASPAINRGEPLEPSSPARPSPLRCGVDPLTRSIEKPRIMEDAPDEGKARELAEIVDPSKCRVVTMPDGGGPASKVGSVIYTNSGGGILALGSDGILKIWKWMRNEHNPSGKATASIVPQHWQPTSGLRMINDVSDVSLEERVPCSALSKNDSYVMSACGGKVTLFNLMTFKVMTQFMLPPPTTNFLVFHPKDNNVLAVGMEDSTIHIYNVRVDEVKTKLKGHQKRITGLTFSTNLKVLVSSGADAQLCSWDTDTWEKRKTVTIQVPSGEIAIGETGVQFHSDQTRLLVFHETQLAIYDASKMECIRQWVPQEVLSAPISYAAYSCNCQLIYAAFSDGNLGVFNAESLILRCRIAPAAYLSQAVSNSGNVGIPVIAAHPQEPNQFAIGLTDGTVKVLEPLESGGGWWGVGTPAETVGTSDQAATEPRPTQP